MSITLFYENEPGPTFTDSPLNAITGARDALAHFVLGQSDDIFPELLDRSKAVCEYICEHKCYAIDEKGDAVDIVGAVRDYVEPDPYQLTAKWDDEEEGRREFNATRGVR